MLKIVAIKPAGVTFGMRGTEAHGWPCPYCATVMMNGTNLTSPTTDHVIPRSKGGCNLKGNLLAVCRRCNADKDNMTLFEFGGWLLAGGDPRYEHVSRLVHSVAAEANFTANEMAAMYAEFGIGAARFKANASTRGRGPEPAHSTKSRIMAKLCPATAKFSDPYDAVLGKPIKGTLAYALRFG